MCIFNANYPRVIMVVSMNVKCTLERRRLCVLTFTLTA